MQNRDNISLETQGPQANCAFCRHTAIASVLKETAAFLLAADHAPLVEGHLLIIPKQHYACYGAVPAELDAEFDALKREVGQFMTHFYAPPIFWEHGVFRQTVFHAHLHCIPFGASSYDLATAMHSEVAHSQEDIRRWYATRGHYFYLEDSQHALLFAPEAERYARIAREVLWQNVISHHQGRAEWRTSQQRYDEGAPLITAMTDKWRVFQERGADDDNDTAHS
ncbi:MAG: HIT domain-containing protein [Chloroflexota bacterium]|nr:HIT domain-containing protein [Chloroflexota bacterium]